MRDLKLVTIDEPFTKLLTQGMVLNHVWSRATPQGGIEYFPPAEVTPVADAQGHVASGRWRDGSTVDYGGIVKMGKTERNGVDPQDLIDRYGADTARLFVMFASPPEQTLEWNDAGVEGANRFLRRVWKFAAKHLDAGSTNSGRRSRAGHRRGRGRGRGRVRRPPARPRRRLQRRRCASSCTARCARSASTTSACSTTPSSRGAMKLLNALEAHAGGSAVDAGALREGFGILLRVLYPACPHTTWVLWRELGFGAEHGDLLDAPWPAVDERGARTRRDPS